MFRFRKPNPALSIQDFSLKPGENPYLDGLEQTLQVEFIYGDKREVRQLEPLDAPAGMFANFPPTRSEQYSYRLFGTVEGTPIDLTFSCNPAGHIVDRTTVKERGRLSPSVTRVYKIGSIVCPDEKRIVAFGFPDTTVTKAALHNEVSCVLGRIKFAGNLGSGFELGEQQIVTTANFFRTRGNMLRDASI